MGADKNGESEDTITKQESETGTESSKNKKLQQDLADCRQVIKDQHKKIAKLEADISERKFFGKARCDQAISTCYNFVIDGIDDLEVAHLDDSFDFDSLTTVEEYFETLVGLPMNEAKSAIRTVIDHNCNDAHINPDDDHPELTADMMMDEIFEDDVGDKKDKNASSSDESETETDSDDGPAQSPAKNSPKISRTMKRQRIN